MRRRPPGDSLSPRAWTTGSSGVYEAVPMRYRAAALLVLLACSSSRPAAVGSSADPSPQSWANGAVFYEVFVRSFQGWGGDGNGDLKGLDSRLDYLNDGDPGQGNDLAVDALWLIAVFASPSNHGYDTLN